MLYVFMFLAGGVAAGAAIGIWHYATVQQLLKTKQSLTGWHNRLESGSSALREKQKDLDESLATFEARKVRYDDLFKESSSLKQDLFNLSVTLKKTGRDHATIERQQGEISQRVDALASRYLKENVSWIATKLNSNNFSTSKKRLLKVIELSRDIGFSIPDDQEAELLQDLKENYEQAVRAEFQRQEQARIREQIREEQKLAREIDKQIKDAERERAAVQAALAKALKEAVDEHSAEIEHLRARLREAEENAQRAKSQAQMTKAGYVYVISNIGSFGEGVFKVGMTRRLEPLDRVRELGDASVPFPFDVHMMISCDDAPSLENALHRELHRQHVNKVNPRKEFFRADIEAILSVVKANHGEVDYVAEPAALQYRETLEMSNEDSEFIEETVQSLLDEEDVPLVDE